MRIKNTISFILMLLCCVQCIEPIEPEEIGFDNLLVVEGLFTDQMQHQVVKLSRTRNVSNLESEPNFESGASVWVEEINGDRIDFEETSPGRYESINAYAGSVGRSYQLFVQTSNGNNYQSTPVEMLATPSIDSIYARFIPEPTSSESFGGIFEFYLNATQNPENHPYFRWIWNSTFELSVPNPSRWLWTGGNTFTIRELGGINDSLQVEKCWVTRESPRIIVQDLLTPGTGVEDLLLESWHSDTKRMRVAYSIEAKQYAISRESFNFWNEIARSTQELGFLFDSQVGTITGNLTNIEDPVETVLGRFDAAQEVSVRRFFVPQEFNDAGFRRQDNIHWVNCDQIEPIVTGVDEIGETMEELGDAWTLNFFVTFPPSVYYFPRRCSDCTLYGSNQRPSFWPR
jgi:hypothetical protein